MNYFKMIVILVYLLGGVSSQSFAQGPHATKEKQKITEKKPKRRGRNQSANEKLVLKLEYLEVVSKAASQAEADFPADTQMRWQAYSNESEIFGDLGREIFPNKGSALLFLEIVVVSLGFENTKVQEIMETFPLDFWTFIQSRGFDIDSSPSLKYVILGKTLEYMRSNGILEVNVYRAEQLSYLTAQWRDFRFGENFQKKVANGVIGRRLACMGKMACEILEKNPNASIPSLVTRGISRFIFGVTAALTPVIIMLATGLSPNELNEYIKSSDSAQLVASLYVLGLIVGGFWEGIQFFEGKAPIKELGEEIEKMAKVQVNQESGSFEDLSVFVRREMMSERSCSLAIGSD